MNKNYKSESIVRIRHTPSGGTAGAEEELSFPPRTTELVRNVAEAYLAVQGLTQEHLKLDEHDQLVHRVSLDLAGSALVEAVTSPRNRNIVVTHWAWFAASEDASVFSSVLRSCGFQVLRQFGIGAGEEHLVHFTHRVNFRFDTLCARTVFLTRQALSTGGLYDGWHVEYEGERIAAYEHELYRRVLTH